MPRLEHELNLEHSGTRQAKATGRDWSALVPGTVVGSAHHHLASLRRHRKVFGTSRPGHSYIRHHNRRLFGQLDRSGDDHLD